MLTQESLFLTRVLGKKSWPKKGSGRRGILWKIHGNPWRIRENPWNINGKSAEIYGESAEIHWKSLENLWKSIIKQALFGYSLLAMVPTFAACASFARGLTFATGPTGSNLCNRSENEIQCRVQLHFSCPTHWLGQTIFWKVELSCTAYWLGPYRRVCLACVRSLHTSTHPTNHNPPAHQSIQESEIWTAKKPTISCTNPCYTFAILGASWAMAAFGN